MVVVVVSFWEPEGVVVVVVTSLREGGGGEEEEKTKQPDKNEEKRSTAISLCRMGEFTFPSELAMLSGAREADFLSLSQSPKQPSPAGHSEPP
jgi:hypothetical protein